MSQKIIEALKKLDPTNDNHWTADGSPRLDTVKMLAADQGLTRDMVTIAAPGFSRANNTLAGTGTPGQTVVTPPVTPPSSTQAPAVTDTDGTSVTDTDGTSDNDTEGASDNVEETPIDGESEEVTAARKVLKDARTKHETLTANAAKLKIEIQEAAKAEDDAYDALLELTGVETTTDAIQGYHASQLRVLEDRSKRIKALRESGYSLKDFMPGKAPIDSALARKNGRGTNRPTR